jgi:hypothetical protein
MSVALFEQRGTISAGCDNTINYRATIQPGGEQIARVNVAGRSNFGGGSTVAALCERRIIRATEEDHFRALR